MDGARIVTRLFAVAGSPIFQSKSPLIFNTAFRDLAIDAVYLRLAASDAEEVVSTARQIGMDGLNITSPFKCDILRCLDEIDPDALTIGAVNTVIRRGSRLKGCNTDGAGVLAAVRGSGIELAGRKAIVLGAGGAGRAACLALVSAGARVILINRTFEKAQIAAERLGCTAAALDQAKEALVGARLLVSAISSGERLIEPSALTPDLAVLEANYGRPSALVEDARRASCTLIDGREWLLGQALPAFELFADRTAPAAQMRRALWKKRLDGRRNIALIGFMGTGKSAVAEILASISGMALVDIDKKIEEKAGMSVSELFAAKGEGEFRKMEQAEIEEMSLESNQVVSCGGGVVMSRPNVRALRNNCLSVWLWADVGTVLNRIGETGTRPLLHSQHPEEAARALLATRIPSYAHTSDLLVNTSERAPRQIAERIWNEVYQAFGR
jgi:shikimate dehydrogenase